ncbi:hypothetical protein BY458DRAFT_505748 [Sporodiniella umbellata]|nr:hypothetical protein BY458DRAFT_505748 [Sporodiniella umbellata]
MSQKLDTLSDLQESTKKLIPAHLRAVYEATRIALDMRTLEGKLANLNQIKSRLSRESKSPESLGSMEDAIKDIKAEISEKEKELLYQEDLAATQFKQIAQNIGGYTDKIKSSVTTALSDFTSSILTATEARINSTNEIIKTLKEEKMSQAEGEAIRTSLEQFKKQVVDFQSKNMETISANNEKLFKDVVERMKKMLDQFEQTEIVSKTTTMVSQQLDEKITQQLERLNQQTTQVNSLSPEQIEELVKKEVNARLGPAQLQAIISNLPDIKYIVDYCKKLPPLPALGEVLPDLATMKETSATLSKEVAALKKNVEETQSIMESMKSQGISANNQASSDLGVLDEGLSKIQAIEREIALMHNNVKMIETAVNSKINTFESNSLSSRKRARSDDDSDDIDESIKARLDDIESKHQKLLDFILQCKDNVLDDMFPTRLEAAMKKIERTLINHETFIAFIVDPFSTKKKRDEIPMKNIIDDKYLNPGMIDCIQQLIKKSTDEATAPLHEQIKQLQEQLNKK